MKKVYERPMMVCDQFTADEFVAACVNMTTYNFKCDVDAGFWGNVYKENPGMFNDEIVVGNGSYHRCYNEVHGVTDLSKLKEGYVYNLTESWRKQPVYYWVDGQNVHCTQDVETVEAWLRS